MQTQYFGGKGGNTVRAYPKLINGIPGMRIERTFKCRKPVEQLQEMDNPFSAIRMCYVGPDAFADMTREQRIQMRWFISHCRARGLKRARKEMPSRYVKPFAERLDALPVEWWRPEENWRVSWTDALKRYGLFELSPDFPIYPDDEPHIDKLIDVEDYDDEL